MDKANKLNLVENTSGKESNKRKNTFIILDFMYLTFVGIFYTLESMKGNGTALVFLLLVSLAHLVGAFHADYSVKNRDKLIKYALKHSEAPKSVIEFKVDAYTLVDNAPEYLRQYKSNDGGFNKLMNLDINMLREKIKPSKSKNAFPLFKDLLVFTGIIDAEGINTDSPFINAYIVDNITFLTTVMTILRDEKMVIALSSDIGNVELKGLHEDFSELNAELRQICAYMKQEKITFEKAEGTAEIIDSLNEIRSMKSFSDMVK